MSAKRLAKTNITRTSTSSTKIASLKRQLAIEAALEKVRVRANAMRRSDQLKEVIQEVFKQLQGLGLNPHMCCIDIIQKKSKDLHLWVATPNADYPKEVVIPHFDNPIFTEYYAARKKRRVLHTANFSKEVKDAFFDFAFKNTGLKSASRKRKDFVFKGTSYTLSSAMTSNLSIWMVNYQGQVFSKEDNNILLKFTRVFDQCYTRFLDIKKAEAQAREAEIEAALERVRARAMALHRSDELKEVIAIIYQELTGLGLELHDTNIAIQDPSNKATTFWGSGLGGVEMPPKFTMPYIDDPVINKVYDHGFKDGPYYWVELKGRALKNFVHIALTQTGFKDAPKEYQDAMSLVDTLFLSQVEIKHGFLEVASNEVLTEDQADILQRFGSVVDLTYTRFDDVVQAEEQAREAQIEVSLERVRSRSMAMQNSNELSEILGLIFKELTTLDVELARCIIWIINPDTETATFWLASPYEGIGTRSYFIPKFNHPYYKQYIKAWKSRETLWKLEVHGKLKETWHDYLFKETELGQLPKDVIKSMRAPDKFYTINTFNKHGLICAAGTAPFSEETNDIFKRFGRVFEQCYTRFEDIKQAEEQAREAQIETALERIRARALAMHSSDEILEVADVLREQMGLLGQSELATTAVHIYTEGAPTFDTWWTFTPPDHSKGNIISGISKIRIGTSAVAQEFIEKYQSEQSQYTVYATGKRLKDWQKELAFTTPELIKSYNQQLPKECYFHFNDFSGGSLALVSYQEPSEESKNLQKRSASVFNLAYQRFLDLKKAEEQAREAQIEAALERVRSRSMSMQQSEELSQVLYLIFEELSELGLELAICIIWTFNKDDKSATWWTVSPELKKTVQGYHIPNLDHQVYRNFWREYRKKNPRWHYELSGQTKRSWDQLVFSQTEMMNMPDQVKDYMISTKLVHLANTFNDHGVLMAGTLEAPISNAEFDILARFGKVFEQSYTRFLDVKKAEEQAREAEIELALERVRARTMAMQHSQELAEAAELLYRQLRELGIDPWTCGYVFIEEEKEQSKVWTIQPNGEFFWGLWTVPHGEEKVLKDRYQSWKRKEKIHRSILQGQDNVDHHIYIASHAPLTPDETKAFLSALPTDLVLTSAHFSHGYLLVITESQLTNEQENLLTRFAKVFELTYTRFLDLEKSEEQARESEIELALERVRARTMAMQHSDELPEVALVIWGQLDQLQLEGLPGCAIHVNDDDQGTFKVWAAFPDLVDGEVKMKLHSHPHSHNQQCTWVFGEWDKRYRAGETGFAVECNTKQLNEFIDWFAPYLPKIAEEMRSLKLDKLYVNGAAFSNGIMGAPSVEPLSVETWSVFKRLAGVFDLAYRRFEDLKKAEEQARESEIELALERVRARTMAMQHSDELPAAANLLFEQVQGLGMPAWSAGYCTWDEDMKGISLWMSSEGVIQEKLKMPLTKDPSLKHFLEAHKRGETFFVEEVGGEALVKHYEYLRTLPGVGEELEKIEEAGFPVPTFQIFHLAYFSKGFLLFITYEPVPEAWDIFKRFGKVFEQTYTRFLDLQRAEEQARESEIELALERIRARTMAMSSSDELAKVATVVFQQLDELGVTKEEDRLWFVIINEVTGLAKYWMTAKGGAEIARSYDLSLIGLPGQAGRWFKRWKALPALSRKDHSIIIKYVGEELANLLKHLDQTEFSEDATWRQMHQEKTVEQIIIHDALFSHGSLALQCERELDKESQSILQRFAQVFEQTYTRFLDLQRAEKQARESDIELALERIRARTMAMQHSNELAEASLLLAQQVKALGIETWGCAFHIYDEDSDTATEWFSNDEEALPTYNLKRENIFLEYYQAGQKGESLYIKTFEGKACQKHYQYLCTLPVVGEALKDMKAKGIPFPTFQIDHVAYFKYGHLLFITFEPVHEAHTIFTRMASVFQQTYTRFLDLRKAEEQARKAQIEASLERVRAKAMAMHSSEDLTETVGQLFKELNALDISLLRCGVGRIHKENRAVELFTFTGTKKGEPVPVVGQAVLSGHPVLNGCFQHWKKQKEYQPVLKGALLKKYYQAIASDYKLPGKQDNQVQYGYFFPFAVGVLYTYTESRFSEEELAIFRKFSAVMGLTYRRFLDLKEAEAQAREAQIEVALERVRARTMAMHKGEELADTALLLFEQITELGIKPRACGFLIMDEESQSMKDWSANLDEKGKASLVTGTLTFDQHPILSGVVDTWKKGKPYFIGEIHGKELRKYYQAVTSKESTSKTIQDKVLSKYVSEWTNSFYFEYGMMYALTQYAIPQDEIDILLRFARVFKLTYRRFLDLKRAEDQAREAHIEASLERVRSRSMAMQSSAELAEILGNIFKELTALDVELERCIIWIVDPETESAQVWIASPNVPEGSESYHFHYFNHPYYKKFISAWKSRESLLELEIKGKLKISWDQYLFEESGFRNLPKDAITAMSAPDRVFTTSTFNRHGLICSAGMVPLSKHSTSIFQRFGRVFEQSYTRFEDIKHAEEQAREAQIEAALERVRNRTLLMQDSGELNEAVAVFFKEFKNMGLLPDEARTYFCHINRDTDVAEVWMTRADGTVMPGSHHTPLTNSAAMSKYYQAWKEGEPTIERSYTGKALQNYLAFISTLPHVKKDRDYQRIFRSPPKRIVMTDANFLQGNIGIMTFEPLNQEAIQVLKRFAKVFEFTYTRFLDLKKSEQQAREEQVEVALERVRASTMAMQTSEKMVEVGALSYRELSKLGITSMTSGITLMGKDERMDWFYMVSPDDGSMMQEPMGIPRDETKVMRSLTSSWEKQESYHIVELNKKETIVHQTYIAENSLNFPYTAQELISFTPDRLTLQTFNFNQGYLILVGGEKLSKDQVDITIRFAKVFEQTYTRFLDLQKAEEQAREAQIEAALERVRAAAMAMHSSDDLFTVANVLHDHLAELGQEELESTIIHIYRDNLPTFDTWYSFQPIGGRKHMDELQVPKDAVSWTREVMKKYSSKEKAYLIESRGNMLLEWYQLLEDICPAVIEHDDKGELIVPEVLYYHFSKFSGGALLMISNEPPEEEARELQLRAAKVFDLAYRRFLDLQNAEAQAREAHIEVALERIRARAMAMHSSEELMEVADVMREQMSLLGQPQLQTAAIHLYPEEGDVFESWLSLHPKGKTDDIIVETISFKKDETKLAREMLAHYRSGEKEYTMHPRGKPFEEWREMIKKNNPKLLEYWGDDIPDQIYWHFTDFSGGSFVMVSRQPPTDDAKALQIRVSAAFDLAYRRFQDLKQAEEQAREAQIEAALERVRAAAMAMHSSDDIFSVAEVLHDQLGSLGQREFESSIIHVYRDPQPDFDTWYSYRSTDGKSVQVSNRTKIPKDACSWTRKVMDLYRSDESTYTIKSTGKMLKDWYQVMADGVAPDVIEYDRQGNLKIPKVLYYHFSKFSGGALLMVSDEPPAAEARDMQRRAATVFDLAYRRFRDLKKAEAQARKSQIDAALERVRASTMAMHSSEDVGKATMVLFKELENLGVETLRCGVSIINENRTMEVWAASNSSGGEVFTVPGIVDMSFHPLVAQLFDDWKSGKDTFTYELKGKEAQRYYRALQKLPGYNVPMGEPLPERHISNGFLFKEGVLFAFTRDYFTEEESGIFKKFTKVFSLTYRRYLDLKAAEARAAEAVLKSSLDRVRAEIASMRTTEDLQRITPLVWRELTSLGVPFFRCGVFIMDESNETVHMYLSNPNGDPLAVLHLDFDDKEIPLVQDAINHWKTQTVHRTHWNQQQFRKFTESLKDRGLIKSLKTYQQAEKPPKNLNLHQVPFKQGMLYVGSSEPLADAQIELVHSLAEAFSVAYARYEDFIQLEEAKKNVENTLADLKSAQDQLIHSEKMASLGELTAGIAHEIQNPLNFVNNFSEVSNELLDEMKEEIESGNHEEVAELVEDLIQNLDKIAHHGKRASGIVKGMLDHSRASSDEKIPTDINALADEYLRLAYHGFRAKDKSFNANFKADLADDIPKMNIVPQDIGRVLLNLVNNAFQAVREVENPEVTVRTQMKDGKVVISVIDNGPGIPEDIKEKIFQPFFTTKAAGEGTGLGLSLSYDIITKGHGGTIEVKSNEREGTEFTLLLPIN